MQKPESNYASDPESASASEDEGGDSEDEQTPKKDTLSKVKSILGFGGEDSDNPSPNVSDSETETETETEAENEEEEEGEGEENPSIKSGFSKLLESLKSAVKGSEGDDAGAGASADVGSDKPSSRKGKSASASAAKASKTSRKKKIRGVQPTPEELEYNSDEDEGEGEGDNEGGDDDDESNLKKFDKELRNEYLVNFHPESLIQNYDEIYNLARVVRDSNGAVIDNLHKTLPILTKYEKTRILGQRAKQINDGATPFIKVPEGIIDGYLIAIKELEEKRIPFIIRRPLPNRGSEYWHIEDLEIIC